MKIISYCLYGSDEKYHAGLVRNLAFIKNYLPDFKVVLFISNGYRFRRKYINEINKYIDTGLLIVHTSNYKEAYLTLARFIPAAWNNVSLMYSKDLDSPV